MFCPFFLHLFHFHIAALKEILLTMKQKNFCMSFTAVTLYTWSAGDKWGDKELFCMCLRRTDSSSLTKADSIILCFYLM